MAPLIERTLRTYEYLRRLVRHIFLYRSDTVFVPKSLHDPSSLIAVHSEHSYQPRLDWLEMIPEQQILSIRFHLWKDIEAVLTILAVRMATHVGLLGWSGVSREVIEILDSNACLTSLSIGCSYEKSLPAPLFKHLKRLSLSTWFPHRELITLIGSLDPGVQLERLDIGVSIVLDTKQTASLLGLIKRHFLRLKHLSIIAQFGKVSLSRDAFMNDIVTELPYIETLYCGHNTYSPALIDLIPPSLHTLGIHWQSQSMRFGQPVTSFPADYFSTHIRRLSSSTLQNFTLILDSLDSGVSEDASILKQACDEKGIVFSTESLYTKLSQFLD